MGNEKVGFHLIFVIVFLLANTCTCLGVRNTSVVCSKEERLALLKFKLSVKDESGMLSSWVGNNCCHWERVQCDNGFGSVKSLDLIGDNHDGEGYHYLVGGEVNSCLANLRSLKYLELSGNDFRGSRIPEFIGSLKHLSYLNLSHSGFQGIVPHHIGNLSSLKVLDLSSNMALMVDDVAWTSSLLSLEHLDLSSVDIGSGQSTHMLLYLIPSLKILRLSKCRLSGAFFGHLLNQSRILPNIKHLDIGLNSFKGPLPRFFQNMTSLSFLDLSGFDPSSTWNFENLLDMLPSLSTLHLSGCGLRNSFLSSTRLNFSRLSHIQRLDLSDNSINGIFPLVLSNMSSIKVLNLKGNKLNSWVPVIPSLLDLDLSKNAFDRIEHVGIWRQCHLRYLNVAANVMRMEISNSLQNISGCVQYALERLDLQGSLRNGTIPKLLERLSNLRFIDLSQNGLRGIVPKSLERLRFLVVLYLSGNQLIGPIPTLLGKLSVIDLSYNLLNGSIPESFGKSADLREVYLTDNQLTGPIPTSLGRLVSLQSMSVTPQNLAIFKNFKNILQKWSQWLIHKMFSKHKLLGCYQA